MASKNSRTRRKSGKQAPQPYETGNWANVMLSDRQQGVCGIEVVRPVDLSQVPSSNYGDFIIPEYRYLEGVVLPIFGKDVCRQRRLNIPPASIVEEAVQRLNARDIECRIGKVSTRLSDRNSAFPTVLGFLDLDSRREVTEFRRSIIRRIYGKAVAQVTGAEEDGPYLVLGQVPRHYLEGSMVPNGSVNLRALEYQSFILSAPVRLNEPVGTSAADSLRSSTARQS